MIACDVKESPDWRQLAGDLQEVSTQAACEITVSAPVRLSTGFPASLVSSRFRHPASRPARRTPVHRQSSPLISPNMERGRGFPEAMSAANPLPPPSNGKGVGGLEVARRAESRGKIENAREGGARVQRTRRPARYEDSFLQTIGDSSVGSSGSPCVRRTCGGCLRNWVC